MVIGDGMLEEKLLFTGTDGTKYDWSSDYGKSCSQWDAALQPDCADAAGNALASPASWCAQNWCYIDNDNCDKAPTASSVFPGATDVYYSTETCATEAATDDTGINAAGTASLSSAVVATMAVLAARMAL
jgi:hypothetical protein